MISTNLSVATQSAASAHNSNVMDSTIAGTIPMKPTAQVESLYSWLSTKGRFMEAIFIHVHKISFLKPTYKTQFLFSHSSDTIVMDRDGWSGMFHECSFNNK